MAGSTILVAGGFDAADPGHDAVIQACAGALPGFGLTVASSDPLTTSARHGVRSVDRADRTEVARVATRADALLIAGTPVFAARPGARSGVQRLSRATAMALTVAARGNPVALLGVGGAPLPGRIAPALARQLVRQADLLVLRDHATARALAATGATAPFRVGADPAWALFGDAAGGPQVTGDAVMVVVSAASFGASVAAPLAAALDTVMAAGLEVRLMPWRTGPVGTADRDLCRRIAERVGWRTVVVPAEHGLDGVRHAIAGARAAVTMPYHAAIAAAAAGVPCVTFGGRPATPALGHPLAWRAVSMTSDPARIASSIIRQAAAPPPTQAAVAGRVAAAAEGFRLLRLLLNGGRSAEADRAADLELAPVAWAR
jgi:polysaccharide pyruvyl transferase WcaK-like protein